MTHVETMQKLMEICGGKPFDINVTEYKQLTQIKDKKYKEKQKDNCEDCNKLIISLKDSKYYIKYEKCEMCYLESIEGK